MDGFLFAIFAWIIQIVDFTLLRTERHFGFSLENWSTNMATGNFCDVK